MVRSGGVRPPETNQCLSCERACTPCLPRNDEADTLAKVQWLEMMPVGATGKVAQWLHCCALHAAQKTTWSTLKTWGLPVTLAEVQEACETCVLCLQEQPQRPVGTAGQVVWGRVLQTQWQVCVVGPLPCSEGYRYAIPGVDTATGLLAAYPARHQVGKPYLRC